jgi:hypothetical protein
MKTVYQVQSKFKKPCLDYPYLSLSDIDENELNYDTEKISKIQ